MAKYSRNGDGVKDRREEVGGSKADTLTHKQKVSYFLHLIIKELIDRADEHDSSKLEDPELALFDEYTPKLHETTYGSEEYNGYKKQLDVALQHHYAHNRHHPEHFLNGIKDMDLVDLIEMVADWKASTLRHDNGNILKSIDQNQERFGYSIELNHIFKNTVQRFEP
jgi:Family of unknown function (DUF5662)